MEDIQNSNPCHNPAGPGGGEFCSGKSGGKSGGEKPSGGSGGGSDKSGASDSKITKKQSDALTTYSGSRFESINSGLRNGNLSAADKKVVADIDSAMSKTKKDSVLFENQELYRGANVPEIAAALKSKKSLVGVEFTDKAYVSTTRDPKVAKSFSKKDQPILVFNAPKGTQAIDMAEHSTFGKLESEVLLGRGQKYKVSRVETKKEKVDARGIGGKIIKRTVNQTYIHVDVVIPSAKTNEAEMYKQHLMLSDIGVFNSTFHVKNVGGISYQVYPCIMLVEGVHHGVGTDPVYYSPDVIANSASQWNNMPVTIGHPVLSDGTHVLCNHDGTIRAEWQVGHVSNVKFEDGKLKAELFINTAICGQKQPELLTFLANGGQLDVSTGMLAAGNGTAGNWNGEDFSTEIIEIIPDHLALLPNSTGACSWNDGCGVRFNQANGKTGEKVFINSTDLTVQIEKIRSYVYGLDVFPKDGIGGLVEHWLKAVYSDYFIFKEQKRGKGIPSEEKMLKQSYSLDTAGNIVLEGEPVEVVEEISYKIKAVNEGDVANNTKAMEDKIMAKAATPAEKAKCAEKAETPADKAKCKELIVNQMIENADNAFTEDDRTWLMGLEDVQLSKLVVNSEPKEVIVEKIVEKVVTNTATAPTDLNGYLQTAPPEVRAVLNAGLRELDNKRSSLIKIVMEQGANKFTEDSLKEMSVETLESIVALIPQEPVRSFGGMVPASIQMNETGEEPYVPVTLSSVLGKKAE